MQGLRRTGLSGSGSYVYVAHGSWRFTDAVLTNWNSSCLCHCVCVCCRGPVQRWCETCDQRQRRRLMQSRCEHDLPSCVASRDFLPCPDHDTPRSLRALFACVWSKHVRCIVIPRVWSTQHLCYVLCGVDMAPPRFVCADSFGRFSEAGLHEWMPFVIFRARGRSVTSRLISE